MDQEQALETARQLADTRLRTYLAAFSGDWLTRMSGPLSVPFAAVAIWSSSQIQKVLWICLAVAAAVVGTYRVWRKECSTWAAEIKKLNMVKDQEIASLNERIIALSRKQYPEDLESTARQVLQHQMTRQGRHVLRHLLLYEPVEIGTLSFPEIPQDRQYAEIEIAMRGGLIRHREDRQGALLRTYWVINPQFRPVLENVLYEKGMLD